MTQTSFNRELRALMRAPYALIHLDTYEESRALHLIRQLASADRREVLEWDALSGFGEGPVSLLEALQRVFMEQGPAVFVYKDAAPYLDDPRVRRRLREVEEVASRSHKTMIFLGPAVLPVAELRKELTTLRMPLPTRPEIRHECARLFPSEHFPEVDVEALVSGAMGLTLKEARRALVRVRQEFQESAQRNAPFDLEASILSEKQRLIGSNDALEFFPLAEGLGDVGGLDELKRWLHERAEAFSDEARAFGLPTPKGLLLVGVQGCGKSLTAKVVGRHWGLPLLRLDLGAVFDGRRAPEEALREALATAEALAPCVLWLDEIEKGFAQGDDGRSVRVLGSMLTWLQEKTSPVFMVATANQVDALPPELLRKGRFDEIFFVDLPEEHERRAILEIHLRKRRRRVSTEVLDELAMRTEFFSGSELEQVVVSAMYAAFAQKRDVSPEDMVYAIRETVPLYRTYEEQIKALREWAATRARMATTRRRVLDFFERVEVSG